LFLKYHVVVVVVVVVVWLEAKKPFGPLLYL
jgi:hypothetical protein